MTIDEKYLINPFTKVIESKGFPTSTNLFKLIVGTTGLGKTYTTFNHFIPKLFEEHNLDLIIFSYPQTEVFEKNGAMKTIANTNGVVYTEDLREALVWLDDGLKVLLCVTHHMLLPKSTFGNEFLDIIESKGFKTSWFVDEPHTWLACSHSDHLKDTLGSYTPDYQATLYQQVGKVSKRSPYVFGMTATPTVEHKKLLDPVGDMKFEVINEYPTPKEIIDRCGWFGGFTEYVWSDIGSNTQIDITNTFVNALDIHHEKSDRFGKRAMMITCERANGIGGWTIDTVSNMLLKLYYTHYYQGPVVRDRVSILTDTYSGYVNFPKVGNSYRVEKNKASEDEVKRNLNDPLHPCEILLVIEKGKMGMNVHPLKTYFSFRKTNKKRSLDFNNDPIPDTSIQILGRMMRIWTGVSNRDFVKKWGYGLIDYTKSRNTVQRHELLEMNSFDCYVPKNEMWREAKNEILKLCPTKTMASAWMKGLDK